MQPTYSAFAMIGGQQVKCQPGGVTQDKAREQAQAIHDHFVRFPGGTQSIKVWVELD